MRIRCRQTGVHGLMFQRMRFRLAISAERYLRYYRGRARSVQAVLEDGRQVRFPASALRPFVTHEGIHGCFELTLDERNRLLGLRRLSE
ncbi:MAG: DUF2835 domain-containing protein [Candidatus Sedimenticola endophacoides]